MIKQFKLLIFISTIMTSSLMANSWKIEGLELTNELSEFYLKVEKLELEDQQIEINNIQYSCVNSKQIYPIHRCEKGSVKFFNNNISYDLEVSGWFDLLKKKWLLNATNKDKSVLVVLDSNDLSAINVSLKAVLLEDIVKLAKPKLDIGEIEGSLSSNIRISFDEQISVSLNYNIQELYWESNDGDYIIANAFIEGQLKMIENDGSIEILPEINLTSGESLLKDIYILFDQTPIHSKASILVVENHFQKFHLNIQSKDIFSSSINIIEWQELIEPKLINLDYSIQNLDEFYKGFIASYFELLGVSKGEFSGELNGKMLIKEGQIDQLVTYIFGINGIIPSKKIEIDNLNGELIWIRSDDFNTSSFNWDHLILAGMPLKKSEINLQSNLNEVILRKDTEVPVFDGSVLINNLHLKNIFESFVEIDFNGEVLPISLELITKKLDWPVMSGKISGVIPGLKKVGNKIDFLGELELNVFDGNMKISNLSTERLFGVAPVIAGNINFNDLNLEQITNTYDFGEITGLVDGYINDLRITNWKADRLEAYIETIKSKKVKQTISQRALDNISSIGGVQGAISNSFLKFFDSFKFSKLAIGCKLRNSICEMSGISSTKDGYYLVKGKGIPRINIVGYRKFIDWEVFLERLFNAKF